MEHADDDKFLINMHAIHNVSLIWETVKAVYGGPKPYFGADQRSHHDAAAVRLQVSGPKKQSEANKKCQATRERNKSTKCAQASEEANMFLKTHHSRDSVPEVEGENGDNGSRSEGVESDGEREDAMEVD